MLKTMRDYLAIQKSGYFDPGYYLKNYADVRIADMDPLYHFVKNGWKEFRNPSSIFNTRYYLDSNPDVKQIGINPLIHYIKYGKKEGRLIAPPKNQPLLTREQLDYKPLISIIVPNYNHSRFLGARLDSIYDQTYKNFEVILLDDYSSDDSRSLLTEYAQRNPKNTRCAFNEKNSGSPFKQWKKGISLAKGELIWIAESDDFSDSNFLESMIPYFADESILMAFSHSVFVDVDAKKHSFAFESYVSQIDAEKWNSSYINTAHNEVNTALGLLNTIPNVSSVVFRKLDNNFALFSDPEWEKMKVCGDWIFYLHLIRGGRIAYCAETNNYYRIHQSGTSKKAQIEELYYREHEKVGCTIARLYNVPDELLYRLNERLSAFYFNTVKDPQKEIFESCFDIKKVIACKKERKPNVLMAAYAFAFGGGEIYPVRLANALDDAGASITFFNGGFQPTQAGVRKMLHRHIAVINNNQFEDNRKMLAEFGIEIIHTHHASMENFFACCTSKSRPHFPKHIATTHGMYEMMDNFPLYTKDIFKSVDFWVYTTDKNVGPFKEKGLFSEDRFTKISNGMKIQNFDKEDLTSLGIGPDSFTVCLGSRALIEKGWKEAIAAVGKAREKTQEDIHLILIGEGPVYDELSEEKIPAFIHLLGYKTNLDNYLAASQLALLPSYFKGESFPLFLIECFMTDTPVVATKIGEIEQMMRAENGGYGGILLDLKNEKVNSDDLADAIIKMVSDKEYYQQCLENLIPLKKRFDINLVAEKYLSVYQNVLKK